MSVALYDSASVISTTGTVVHLTDAVAQRVASERKSCRIGRTRQHRVADRRQPSLQIPVIRGRFADLEIERRVDELEQLRLDGVGREQLQQRFGSADVAARIAADIQNEALLRKALFRDQPGERLEELPRIADVEAEDPE